MDNGGNRATIAVVLNDDCTVYGRRYISKYNYKVGEEELTKPEDIHRLSKDYPAVYRGGQIVKQGKLTTLKRLSKDVKVYSNKDGELRAWANGSYVPSGEFLAASVIHLFGKSEFALRVVKFIADQVAFNESDEIKLGLICMDLKKRMGYKKPWTLLACVLKRSLDLLNPQIILPGNNNGGVIIQRAGNDKVSVKSDSISMKRLGLGRIVESNDGNIILSLSDYDDMYRRYEVEISKNGSSFNSYFVGDK